MKYFDFHPNIQYSFNGVTKDVIDIFRTIKLNITSFDNIDTQVVGNKEFPENISYQYYQDEKLSWTVPIFNNIISSSDWFLPNDIKLSELMSKYENQIIYSITTLPDLIENDIIVKGLLFEGPKGYVKNWDSNFRSITTIHSAGESFDSGDNITFWRKTDTTVESISFLGMGNTGNSGITTSTEIQKKTEILDYPIIFMKENIKVSPYYGSSPGNTFIFNDTLALTGVNGFTHTVLNKFNKSLLNDTFTYNTTKDLYLESTFSNIKLLKKVYINNLELQMKDKFKIINKYRIYEINI